MGLGFLAMASMHLTFLRVIKVKANQATGLITVLEREACEEKMDRELKNLVMEKWDFRVRKVDHQEFAGGVS